MRLEARGDGQYALRGPGQWLGTDGAMHSGPIDVSMEKTWRLIDLGGSQFALFDGQYAFADYNAGGILSGNPGLIHDWWIFTIQPTDPPSDPDPAKYLAFNPDLQAVFWADHTAVLNHWRQYGWAEGRPVRWAWTQVTGDYAHDVSVGPDGEAYYVGTDNQMYQRGVGQLGADNVRHIDAGADGSIWIAKNDLTVWYQLAGAPWVHLEGHGVLDVAVDRVGAAHYVGGNSLVYRYDLSTGAQDHVPGIDNAMSIDVAPDGTVWVTADDTSIWRWAPTHRRRALESPR